MEMIFLVLGVAIGVCATTIFVCATVDRRKP